MKVTITRVTETKEEVEVEFPVYLAYLGNSDAWERYTKIARVLEAGYFVEVGVQQAWGAKPEFSFQSGKFDKERLGRELSPYISGLDPDHRIVTAGDFAELYNELKDRVCEVVLL